MAKIFNTDCVIYGELDDQKRQENIKKFQENEQRLIICSMNIIDGLSLHDLHGVQRVSIISPSFSSVKLVQALGRIARAGAKTPALQRLVYTAGTIEEVVCNRVNEKLQFLSKLNDSDLIPIDVTNVKGNIDVENIQNTELY